MIVRDVKRKTNHAVVAVRHEDEWLILDNRTLIMANAEEASQYSPLLVLDHRGVRTSEIGGIAPPGDSDGLGQRSAGSEIAGNDNLIRLQFV